MSIFSDHQPLEYMNRQVSLHSRGRVTRWFLFMQDFRLSVHHVPGASNEFADALSRMFQESSVRDPDQQLGLPRAIIGRNGVAGDGVAEQAEAKMLDVAGAQRTCPEVIAIRHWIARGELPDAWTKNTGPNSERLKGVISRRADRFVEKDGVLYVAGDSGRPRLVVPVALRRMLLEQAHDAPTGGHRGSEKTTERLKLCYWWPKMKEDVAAYVRSCHECARAKRPWPSPGDLQPSDVAKVFEYMHVDLVGPLPTTLSGSKYILAAVDKASKRTVLMPLPNKESRTVARALVRLVCWHGSAPAVIQSDQGTEFLNAVVADMSHLLGISHVRGAAYHPQTNGQVERMNLQLEQMLAIFGDLEQRTWDSNLDFVMYALNNSRSEVTGETPHFLSWGRRALEPLDLLFGVDPDPVMSKEHWLDRLKKARELAARNNEAANRRMKDREDREKEPHNLAVGDSVWVKEKRVPKGLSSKLRPKAADVQYKVVELTGGGEKHARVEAVSNSLDKRSVHVDRLKRVVDEPLGIFGEEGRSDVVQGDADDVYEVERILGHRAARSGKGVEYYIRFKGYGADEDRWVAEKDVHASECIAQYEREQAAKKAVLAEPTILTYAEIAKRGKPQGESTGAGRPVAPKGKATSPTQEAGKPTSPKVSRAGRVLKKKTPAGF